MPFVYFCIALSGAVALTCLFVAPSLIEGWLHGGSPEGSPVQALRDHQDESFRAVVGRVSNIMLVRVEEYVGAEKYSVGGYIRSVYRVRVLKNLKGSLSDTVAIAVAGGIAGDRWELWRSSEDISSGTGEPPRELLDSALVPGRLYVIVANYDDMRGRYAASIGAQGVTAIAVSEHASDAEAVSTAMKSYIVKSMVADIARWEAETREQ